jgi:hypothetical protein
MLDRASILTCALLLASPASLAGDAPERDRAAIRAMAGTYTVTFDFRETVPVEPGYTLHEPYHATADAELVVVVADEPRRIDLQHVLLSNGAVVKHWRQEWLYENRDLYEFVGDRTWRHRRLDEDEVRGTWTQRVYQVDDSPRYQGFGRWMHDGELSAWESGWTWRPLPRREFTKRSDYDVLVARNRQTLTHTGWVHEQDNYKLVLRDGKRRVLAREVGFDRYAHVDPGKADAALGYWTRTADFWSEVREVWDSLLVPGATVQIRAEIDDKTLYKSILELADGDGAPADRSAEVRATVQRYLEAPALQATRQ